MFTLSAVVREHDRFISRYVTPNVPSVYFRTVEIDIKRQRKILASLFRGVMASSGLILAALLPPGQRAEIRERIAPEPRASLAPMQLHWALHWAPRHGVHICQIHLALENSVENPYQFHC